ncbi:MAG: hypothetical protein AB7I50_24955 [Vicinamibacterales bacterium]
MTNDRATGVRLTDGTMLEADVVVSTSSAPETVFRLLAGHYGASEWKTRVDQWRMFQPIVLASFGVAQSFNEQPSTLLVDGIEPLTLGGYRNEHLYLRIYNEDPAFAPPGHTVVQAMLSTEYDWWATRGAQYQREKELAADHVLACLDQHLAGVKASTEMVTSPRRSLTGAALAHGAAPSKDGSQPPMHSSTCPRNCQGWNVSTWPTSGSSQAEAYPWRPCPAGTCRGLREYGRRLCACAFAWHCSVHR